MKRVIMGVAVEFRYYFVTDLQLLLQKNISQQSHNLKSSLKKQYFVSYLPEETVSLMFYLHSSFFSTIRLLIYIFCCQNLIYNFRARKEINSDSVLFYNKYYDYFKPNTNT